MHINKVLQLGRKWNNLTTRYRIEIETIKELGGGSGVGHMLIHVRVKPVVSLGLCSFQNAQMFHCYQHVFHLYYEIFFIRFFPFTVIISIDVHICKI